jgi:hypothetical protein
MVALCQIGQAIANDIELFGFHWACYTKLLINLTLYSKAASLITQG